MEHIKEIAQNFNTDLANIINAFKDIIQTMLDLDVPVPSEIADAAQAVAVSLTALFLAMEYISYFSSMRMEGRIEDAIQFMMKLVISKLIVENTDAIMGGIYQMFRGLGSGTIGNSLEKMADSLPDAATDAFMAENKGLIGEGWILTAVFTAIAGVFIVGSIILMTMEIIGIIFEIAIHQAVGPIAISTLANSTMRSTGMSFIKSYSAVCLQTTVIGAIFYVFGSVSTAVNNAFANNSVLQTAIANLGAFGMIFRYISPLLMAIVLSVSVKKSGEITKRMFGA